MASRRAAASLVKATAPLARTATPAARVRVTAQSALRQYHNHTPLIRRQQQSSALSSPLISKAAAGSSRLATARAYSTDAEAKPHKIWDFEALQQLTAAPSPSSITIIDVREPHELQSTGRIPGALNIPLTSAPDSFHITPEEFEDRFGFPRPGPDAEVVFYCRAGVRSRAAAGLARDAGWEKVGEYPGSWLDWAERGGKVQR
ncbi:Rhodanese-like domain-containing protein [Chaetomidium leptoderma]|uniref:Rhodanese-like domain-containing protein n=1 Tax=Chaetomidium leptoderma TaxID=669021 RepID=A0AAN6VTL7_9PEZI|nr:Rhodanese-like domain-containing protein [Chaetomidium leptoderma]